MHKTDNDRDIPALEALMTDMVREDYELIRKRRQQMLRHRTASGIVGGLYLLIAIIMGEIEVVVRLSMFLILPLSAIWFSGDLGSLTGLRFGRLTGPVVTTASPGVFVRIAGWVLLHSPVAGALFGRQFWK